jgi:hypothetical protein
VVEPVTTVVLVALGLLIKVLPVEALAVVLPHLTIQQQAAVALVP